MKKIFSLIALIGCFMSSAHALECETLITGKFRFGCDATDQGAQREYDYGEVVQTVGAAWCANHSGTSKTKYYNLRFKCTDTSGQHDDWQTAGVNYCSDTQLKGQQVENARYEVIVSGKVCAAVDSWNDSVNSDGCKDGCLKVTCKPGYAKQGDKCVAVDNVATCIESSVKHSGSIACNSSGGAGCLQTGNNTFLYCYTKDKLKALSEDFLLNSCVANTHRVRIPSQPRAYFECVPGGTWKKHTFEMCKSGSDFPGGCNGINGCVEQIVDASGNKVVVDASATAQKLVMNSGMTFCVRAVCKDGWVKSGGKCITKQAQQQAAATTQANKQKCEQSWGTWSGGKCVCDASKNLINDTNVSCACKSASYERNEASKSCEMTSVAVREQKCKDAAASGAMWTGDKCVCELPHREWNGVACTDPAGYAQCKAVQGAMWNTTMKTCVCTDSTKVFDGTKCVESEETKQKREVAAAQLAVTDAVARLDSIVSTLEVSKWKDAEGKFNTARLASDSIAGVVLGTAGGLITSSVVKKHQVEEGFEDLQCVIGGQTVAGWGDEFTVGVQ